MDPRFDPEGADERDTDPTDADSPWGALPPDPDDEPEESPYDWLAAEWLPADWVHPEVIQPSAAVERWRRRSVAGAVLTGFAFGLRAVLEPEREDPPIIVEAPGEPPGPRRVELHLDLDDPGASTAVVRRWVPRQP